jgi:dipeptidyl aminopeptidase/acylaminoacyl peptidase
MKLETHPFVLDEHPDPLRVVRGKVVAPEGYAASDRAHVWQHVFLLHGFKGFMDWGFFPHVARTLAERGLAVVCFNTSGSGVGEDPLVMSEVEAFAKNTSTREIEDLERVRRAAHEGRLGATLDPLRAGLLGHSRGGGVALLHAAHHGGWRALATWAAIDDIDRLDEATKRHWRAAGELVVPNHRTGQLHRLGLDILDEVERRDPRLDVLAAAARVQCPALVVHGTADEAVPFSAAEALMARLPRATLERVEAGGHSFGATHPLRPPLHPHLERTLDVTVQHFVRHLVP